MRIDNKTGRATARRFSLVLSTRLHSSSVFVCVCLTTQLIGQLKCARLWNLSHKFHSAKIPTKQANHRADQDHRMHAKIIKKCLWLEPVPMGIQHTQTGAEREKEARVSIKTINTYFIVLDCRDSLCLVRSFFRSFVHSLRSNGLRVYLNILMTV